MNLKYIFVLIIIAASCNNNISPENIHHQSWKYPVVKVIFFTDASGNQLGEWYNPYIYFKKNDSNIIRKDRQNYMKTSQNSLQISNSPLVKPTASTTFQFQVPKRTHVLIYIVPAVLNPKDSDPIHLNTVIRVKKKMKFIDYLLSHLSVQIDTDIDNLT